MDIRIYQPDLLHAINTVKRASSTQTIVPILSGVLLTAGNNLLALAATDTQIRIETSCAANISQEGSLVLPTKYLAEIVRRIPDTHIHLSVQEDPTAIITWGKAKYKINGFSPDSFPEYSEVENAISIEITERALRSLVRKTVFAAARDDTRVILTGAQIRISNENVQMVATDGVRLSKTEMKVENLTEEIEIIVPYRSLAEAVRMCDGEEDRPVGISISEKHVVFHVGGSRLVSNLLGGKYPNYQRVFPDRFESIIHLNRSDLHDALDRASLISSGASNAVRLFSQNGVLSISSIAPEVGQVVEEIDAELTGEDVDVYFNANYVIDGLKAIDEEQLVFQVPQGSKASLIKALNDDSFTYLVLPLKVS